MPEGAEWRKTLAEQAQAMQRLLQQFQHPVSAIDLNKVFKSAMKVSKSARQQQIESLLETFSILGLMRKTGQGLYVGSPVSRREPEPSLLVKRWAFEKVGASMPAATGRL